MNSYQTDIDPFAEVAAGYDASFTLLPSVVLLRQRIHRLVARYFPADGTVLDLACGTGEDTVLLAARGFQVVGADRSPGMLGYASAKSNANGVDAQFLQIDAASLAMFRDSSFDAILSNFGGLNCVPDLCSTLSECHRVLRPGGVMVLCLLGANAIWETGAFALRGSWGRAFRRRSGEAVDVPVGTQTVATWYHSVRSLRASLNGLFEIVKIAALNVVAPPPASQAFMRRHPAISRLLYGLDARIQSVPLVRALGDHTVFVLRRRAPA